LDKLATKYDTIFQLHLNNVATLPCKNFKVAVFQGIEMERCECLPFATARIPLQPFQINK